MSATHVNAEDTLKDLWATRPRRPRKGRKIAGVAAGIANRYRIDPVLVRVGLVVAAVYGGAGILVYLLGWLFLPEQDDQVSPFESLIGKGRSSTSSFFTVLLCIALIPVFSWFFNDGFLPGWLGLLVVAGLLYLLHHSRGHLRPVTPAGATESPPPPTTGLPLAMTMEPPMTTTPGAAVPHSAADGTAPITPTAPTAESAQTADARTSPPAWDPLGAAPFAWDLPEPAPPPEEEPEPPVRRRKSRIGLMAVGAALIVGGGLSLGMGGWVNPQHIVGIVLAILGLGMVFGAFVRGGRGLIGLAVPLSLVGIGLTVVGPDGLEGGVHDYDETPHSIAAVQPEYRAAAGSIRLDLTQLPTSGEVETKIDLGVGDVQVILPPNADVTLECSNDLGEARCLNRLHSGPNVDLPKIEDLGEDNKESNLKIDIEVEVGAGDLEVSRG